MRPDMNEAGGAMRAKLGLRGIEISEPAAILVDLDAALSEKPGERTR